MHGLETSISRRNLMVALCASGVAAACGSGSAPLAETADPTARAASNGRVLATGMMGDWAAIVGATFDSGGGNLLKLAGVEPLPSRGSRPAGLSRDRAFVAVFDAVGGEMTGGLIYSLSAPNYGPLDVFLAEAASPEFPRRMHAVFN